jgi:hypothetical protein
MLKRSLDRVAKPSDLSTRKEGHPLVPERFMLSRGVLIKIEVFRVVRPYHRILDQ